MDIFIDVRAGPQRVVWRLGLLLETKTKRRPFPARFTLARFLKKSSVCPMPSSLAHFFRKNGMGKGFWAREGRRLERGMAGRARAKGVSGVFFR